MTVPNAIRLELFVPMERIVIITQYIQQCLTQLSLSPSQGATVLCVLTASAKGSPQASWSVT
ncbi:hypothetical protein IFO70_24080 [Phormidium tenue FACHB-886]|nr:hypothetical protein [Phormidium tenue FACHB-886]